MTVSTRPRGAPFVYEATLDAQVLSEDLGSSSSRPYMSHHHRSKGGSSKGSKALLKGQQHKWIAELRVRTATPEEEALELPSWTRLELRRLKPSEKPCKSVSNIRLLLLFLAYFALMHEPLL